MHFDILMPFIEAAILKIALTIYFSVSFPKKHLGCKVLISASKEFFKSVVKVAKSQVPPFFSSSSSKNSAISCILWNAILKFDACN